MATDLTDMVHHSTKWSMATSVLLIAAGVLAMVLPLLAGFAITAIVGSMLIFSGVLHFALAWQHGRAGAVIWEILLGVAYGVIGFYVLANPLDGLASLTLAIGLYLVIEAALEAILAFELLPAAGSGWLLVDGIITLVLAMMIWTTWPSSAEWVVGTLVGISMLFSGITRLVVARAVRR